MSRDLLILGEAALLSIAAFVPWQRLRGCFDLGQKSSRHGLAPLSPIPETAVSPYPFAVERLNMAHELYTRTNQKIYFAGLA